MARPAKRCSCPQCQGDRWGNFLFLGLVGFTVVMLGLQLMRMAHVWPFS